MTSHMCYILIFKTHFTKLSFNLLLLVSDIWKGPYYYAFRKYLTVLHFIEMSASQMSGKGFFTAL